MLKIDVFQTKFEMRWITQKISAGYEEGKISIFTERTEDKKFTLIFSDFGRAPKARLGSAIASLGDLDNDGFGDFAVGAPFEDNGAGVVILYFGRKDIEYIDKKEIIKASPGHMGFGASFSKKYMDIDNNQLSDLAVGSYMSGRGGN